MSAYNKPYFLVRGKTSGKTVTRRYYTIGGSNCKSFFPSKVRINGKLEDYSVLNSTEYIIWTYWQLKELQKLAEFLNSKCLDEKQKSINNICIFMTEENLNTFKKVIRYKSFFQNLYCLLKNMYNIKFWKEEEFYFMCRNED